MPNPTVACQKPPQSVAQPEPTKSNLDSLRSLVRSSSIELSLNGRETVESVAGILPPGLSVYVPRLPKQRLSDKLLQIRALAENGFRPVPHLAARNIASELELDDFVAEAIALGGVDRVLVIGGDYPEAKGPYHDSADVIRSGVLARRGIRYVDVAAYPDGHPRIPTDVLARDLDDKITLAKDQGLELGIATQFTFSAERLVALCQDLAVRAPGVPVYAGLAGPSSPTKLLRFAKICGVSASLRALNKLGTDAIRLARNASPDRQVDTLVRNHAAGLAGNLAGIHLFSFGGFEDSARWMDGLARRAGLSG